MTIELIKKAIRVGNSAGVLLPKKFLGAEVKITIIKKAINYKKISLKILSPYLEDIEAACILETSPLEIIAITTNTKKILKNSQIKISFVPKNLFIKDYNISEMLRKKISKASHIINKNFFEKL
jgi:hypothetical protein